MMDPILGKFDVPNYSICYMGLILLLELVYKTWGILEYAIFGLKPPNVHTRDLVLFGLVHSSLHSCQI